MAELLITIPNYLQFPPHFIQNITKAIIALSGGRDSAALLSLIAEAKLPWDLVAVHVHHGLLACADDFAATAAAQAKRANIPFEVLHLQLPRGGNIEARARKARYRALSTFLTDETHCVLTAHHEDDVAETVLLQLVRGAGLKGLAAMPTLQRLGKGWHARPLLAMSREALNHYALEAKLTWIEDPSNQDLQFARNAMRHIVLPALQNLNPQASANLARSARHLQSALRLTEQCARADLEMVMESDATLKVAALLLLTKERQVNLLRYWLYQQFRVLPNTDRLNTFLQQLHAVKTDSRCTLAYSGGVVCYSRGKLFPALQKTLPCLPTTWEHPDQVVSLSNGITVQKADLEGLAIPIEKLVFPLTIRPRQGGERCYFKHTRFSRALKKVLQALDVPQPVREAAPLVYQGKDFVAMIGVFADKRFTV